jgi:hypothetical protein
MDDEFTKAEVDLKVKMIRVRGLGLAVWGCLGARFFL